MRLKNPPVVALAASLLSSLLIASEAHAELPRVVVVLEESVDGKKATTHWRHVDKLRALYPKVRVEPEVLYVDEGRILTSAGSAAGIDLCLHIVRQDYGAEIANRVAEELLHFVNRHSKANFWTANHRVNTQNLASLIEKRPTRMPRTHLHIQRKPRFFIINFREFFACTNHNACGQRI